MTIAKQSLLEAAKAVVENWYQNKAVVDSIEALLQAVQDADHIEDSLGMVYTPLTDDNRRKIMQEFIEGACSYKTLALNVERAVIERLGMRWPE